MWELTNAAAKVPVVPENFRFESSQDNNASPVLFLYYAQQKEFSQETEVTSATALGCPRFANAYLGQASRAKPLLDFARGETKLCRQTRKLLRALLLYSQPFAPTETAR
jgi:hypothetical protein